MKATIRFFVVTAAYALQYKPERDIRQTFADKAEADTLVTCLKGNDDYEDVDVNEEFATGELVEAIGNDA